MSSHSCRASSYTDVSYPDVRSQPLLTTTHQGGSDLQCLCKGLWVSRLPASGRARGTYHCFIIIAKVLRIKLTLPIQSVVMWSGSTTVLSWIQSESNQYKVLVYTRVTEILDLTTSGSCRYINTDLNPADDITRGKTLLELSQPNRWSQGPEFLYQCKDHWPV